MNKKQIRLLKDTFQKRQTPKSDFLLKLEAQQRNAKRREARKARQRREPLAPGTYPATLESVQQRALADGTQVVDFGLKVMEREGAAPRKLRHRQKL